jgi:hypothetical protein
MKPSHIAPIAVATTTLALPSPSLGQSPADLFKSGRIRLVEEIRISDKELPENALFRNPRGVKGRAFGSPLARGLYPRASTAEHDPRARPGAPAAVE